MSGCCDSFVPGGSGGGGGGGGIDGIGVEDEGIALPGVFVTLNFIGDVVATDGGGGTANITVSGGGMTIGGAIAGGTDGSVLFVGAGSTLEQDNANFFWDNTNNRLGIGTAVPDSALHVVGDTHITGKLTVDGAIDPTSLTLVAAGNLAYQEQAAGQAVAVSPADRGRLIYNQGTQAWQVSANGGAYVNVATGSGMAIGGTIVGATVGSVLFAGAAGVLAQDNANFFWDDAGNALSMGGGSAAGASIANKGRIIYDEVAQRFKASLNTSAYFEIGTLSGALTTGSVLFANSLGQIAQDNANFFFADATNRLGIGLAAPAVSLDVVNATAAQNTIKIRSTITSGYSAIELVSSDAVNLTSGAIGFGNSAVGIAHLQSRHFWLSGDGAANIPNIVFASSTVNALEFRMVNTQVGIEFASGTSSAGSGANRGRLIYSAGGDQAFRVSENGGSYVTLAKQAVPSFTTGSVIFASATNVLGQDNANLFFDDAGNRLSLGSATPMGYRLSIISRASENCIGVRALDTASYAGMDLIDSAGTQRGSVGAGGSTTGNALQGRNFLLASNAFDWIMSDATTVWMRWYCITNSYAQEMANGSGAANALANTGKLRYNTTGQKFQVSANAAAYFDVATYAAALTTGSIPFANASNQLAQDNANLFWDDANNRLGIGIAAPLYSLHVVNTVTAQPVARLRNTSTSGYPAIEYVDSSDVFQASIGWANSAVSLVHLRSLIYLFSATGANVVLANATRLEHQFGMTGGSAFYEIADGAAAAVSTTDRARLIYNDAAAALQLSFDGSSYRDIPVLTTALTSGSVLFAASGRINQDNANFFWDDTNNRLGINDATPSEALDVTGSINMTVSLFRGGTKVVGAQGAAVADAAGGAFIDAEARTAINALLAELRAATGHGLIA